MSDFKSADELNAPAKDRMVKVKVSDMFRKFADDLDRVGKLAGMADPGYAQLSKIVNAIQQYAKIALGSNIGPRGMRPADVVAAVPKAITDAGGGIGLT